MEELALYLNSVQKFIEIQGWLLLTFFICLHNQLRECRQLGFGTLNGNLAVSGWVGLAYDR